MRMGMRRITRLTNGFSKKIENLTHAVSLHDTYYSFARPHQSLKDERGHKITRHGCRDRDDPWSLPQIAALLD